MPVLAHPAVQRAADMQGCDAAELALRWAAWDVGAAVVPKASTPDHIAANWRAVERRRGLDPGARAEISGVPQSRLGTGAAYVPKGRGLDHLWDSDGV